MYIVKVRRVGNSNVITLPKELEASGYVAGTAVRIEQLPDGQIRMRHDGELSDEEKNAIVRRVVAENREALDLLAAYDRGETVGTEERNNLTAKPRG